MGAMSIWHWVIVLAIILILFGPGKLPDVFRQAGKGIKAFKDASEGRDEKGSRADEDADADEEEEIRQEIRRRKAERRKQIAAKDTPDELDDDASERAASTAPRKGKSDT